MSRNYGLYLDDIVTAVNAIQRYTTGYDFEQFAADARTFDAVLHNLVVIGEAASKLPKEVQDQAPAGEWRKIVALRNIVVHEYFGINPLIVWDVIVSKLPGLADACLALIETYDG